MINPLPPPPIRVFKRSFGVVSLLVLALRVVFETEFTSVRYLGTEMLQDESRVPVRGVFVLLFVTISSIEFSTNPSRDPNLFVCGSRLGFVFPFGLFRRFGLLLVSRQKRGPPGTQVLVRKEFLLFFPIFGVIP